MDPKRSYIETVKVFPRNVEMRYFQTWIADPRTLARSYEPGRSPIPASLGFVFHTSMLLLPDKPMIGRYSDPRVGYFDVSFDDYGTPEHRAVKRGFITRYRLEKKHPELAVSEPVKPIVFYISHEVPDKWRPWIKKGIEAWQGAFEQAGFKNAILARDAPTKEEDPDWDPEDVRYSVIRWTPSPRENAMGPAVTDPRSGEVISSHALFWNDVLRLAETWYFTQVSPLDPRAQKLPLPDELMGEVLSYVVTHEVGHALGLRHNFKATSAVGVEQLRSPEWTSRWGTSSSIMSLCALQLRRAAGRRRRADAALRPLRLLRDRVGLQAVRREHHLGRGMAVPGRDGGAPDRRAAAALRRRGCGRRATTPASPATCWARIWSPPASSVSRTWTESCPCWSPRPRPWARTTRGPRRCTTR